MGVPYYQDIADLEEDDRIAKVIYHVKTHGQTVAVLTDDEPGKPERYIAKLKKAYPEIRIVDQFKGPTPGVVTIKIGPPEA